MNKIFFYPFHTHKKLEEAKKKRREKSSISICAVSDWHYIQSVVCGVVSSLCVDFCHCCCESHGLRASCSPSSTECARCSMAAAAATQSRKRREKIVQLMRAASMAAAAAMTVNLLSAHNSFFSNTAMRLIRYRIIDTNSCKCGVITSQTKERARRKPACARRKSGSEREKVKIKRVNCIQLNGKNNERNKVRVGWSSLSNFSIQSHINTSHVSDLAEEKRKRLFGESVFQHLRFSIHFLLAVSMSAPTFS